MVTSKKGSNNMDDNLDDEYYVTITDAVIDTSIPDRFDDDEVPFFNEERLENQDPEFFDEYIDELGYDNEYYVDFE